MLATCHVCVCYDEVTTFVGNSYLYVQIFDSVRVQSCVCFVLTYLDLVSLPLSPFQYWGHNQLTFKRAQSIYLGGNDGGNIKEGK